jgi:prepilin-type N-terminal cleavage/methylation domain-containing protein
MRLPTLHQAGFTLTELLLVMAIMTIVTAGAVPLYQALNNGNQLDAAVTVVAQDLYQAQSLSRNHTQDKNWGVAVNGQVITLFAGTSYATRDTTQDTSYTVPNAIALGGVSQIVYSKLYGLPTTTGSFTLAGGGKNSTVSVNGKGMVEY